DHECIRCVLPRTAKPIALRSYEQCAPAVAGRTHGAEAGAPPVSTKSPSSDCAGSKWTEWMKRSALKKILLSPDRMVASTTYNLCCLKKRKATLRPPLLRSDVISQP